jgi:hypothetical protein
MPSTSLSAVPDAIDDPLSLHLAVNTQAPHLSDWRSVRLYDRLRLAEQLG